MYKIEKPEGEFAVWINITDNKHDRSQARAEIGKTMK